MSETSPPPAAPSFFKKASKSQAKAKVALTGPSGSGKTLSSLLLAKGLTGNGRVAVIDTENASASLYEDRFPGWEYYTVSMNPPYTVPKYLKAIDLAIAEGFDALIIDSLTHVWDAEGGLKQQKDALDSRGGNSFANWAPITKLYEQLKAKILHSPIHMIVTMRSKQEYILEKTSDGKSAPRKVGLAPVMRDGMEYEFTVVFDIGMDHQFMVSKDRTDLFDSVVATITEDTGKTIKNWLAVPAPQPPPEPAKPAAQPPAQSFPEEQFDKVPEPEKESQERPIKGKKSSPKNHAPVPKDDREVLFNFCIERGIAEADLRAFVTDGYGFPYDSMPAWVQNDIARQLENEDFDTEMIQTKTKSMKALREETERIRAKKGLKRDGEK